ncbi:hypothetical protein CVT24_008083 [Panaeolus cyanescens]|uniref:F-box domain-containing protein n=1 Tax=Panaeolus cyanescens TaxID=181874 RepID=A0A409W0K3_9AGAR|nr:hypothetical protein CVT24_008083 [Panaeolus cyanescens]
MQRPSLPYDVIREIFSHIPSNDIATLSACSGTSTMYQSLMQKRIFSSVELVYVAKVDFNLNSFDCAVLADDHSNRKALKLLASLASNPLLAPYVRSLTIRIDEPPTVNALTPSPQDQAQPTSTLTQVLAHLSNLSYFRVVSVAIVSVLYEHYIPSIREAMVDLLLRNTELADVDLCGLPEFPATLLRNIQKANSIAVSSLRTGNVLNQDPLLDPEARISRPKSFRILEDGGRIRGNAIDGILDALKRQGRDVYQSSTSQFSSNPILSFSKLERLDVYHGVKELSTMQALLQFVDRRILKHLLITSPFSAFQEYQLTPTAQLPSQADTISTDLGLEDMISLRSFTLQGLIDLRKDIRSQISFPDYAVTDLMWVSQVINALPQPPNIDRQVSGSTSSGLDFSLRVIFDIDTRDNARLSNLKEFDFTPVIQSMKAKQEQWGGTKASHLDLVVCDGGCKLWDNDLAPLPQWLKQDYFHALTCNPTLQFEVDPAKVILRLMYHCERDEIDMRE